MQKNKEEKDNNPFFFFLRRTKRKFDFKKEITPNINYLKLPKIKRKQIEELKQKYKELIKRKNQQYRENNGSSSTYSSSLYINGMKRNEWNHVIQQYNLLKPYYLKQKKMSHEKKGSFKYDEFDYDKKINKRGLLYEFNININGISKTKSMPDIFKKLNNLENKINIDVALGLGKIEESDSTPFTYFKIENLFNLDNYTIIGFLDGKGKKNYLFCKILKEEIKKYFLKEIVYLSAIDYKKKKQNFKMTSDIIFDGLTRNNFNLIKKALNKIPSIIDEKGIEIDESGCLICLLFFIKEYIISVQIGNINSYFIFKKEQNTVEKFIIKKFNEEHNINNIYEIDRIEENKGNIQIFRNENGIKNERFIINDDSTNYIIDYSRIFCFKKLNQFGIISQPDIKIIKYVFDENNKEKEEENIDIDLISNEKYGDLCYIVIGTEYFFDYFKIQYYVKEINNLIRENKNVYEIVKEIVKISKDNALFHIKDFKQRGVGLILFK